MSVQAFIQIVFIDFNVRESCCLMQYPYYSD